jgi:hypothetical protein
MPQDLRQVHHYIKVVLISASYSLFLINHTPHSKLGPENRIGDPPESTKPRTVRHGTRYVELIVLRFINFGGPYFSAQDSEWGYVEINKRPVYR